MDSSRLLICPGAKKAGTTWLDRVLRRHPQFWMRFPKELDYLFFHPPSRANHAARMGPKLADAKLDPAVREWIGIFLEDWDLETYPRLFEQAGNGFSADVSPNYSRMSADEIRRAAVVVPDAKIVLTLRDPVERAWSHAKNTSRNWNISDRQTKLEKCSGFVNSAVCDLMSDYPRLVRDWSGAFGTGQVGVVFYEEIATRPHDYLDRILTLAGANPFPAQLSAHLEQHYNRGEALPVPEQVRRSLRVRYKPMLTELGNLLNSMPGICGPQPGWITGEGDG